MVLQSKLVTVEILTEAFRNTAEYSHMNFLEVRTLAEHLLSFFGLEDHRIIDNFLNKDDRDNFYMLEDFSFVNTDRDEVLLYTGKLWRIHYWVLNDKYVHFRAQAGRPDEVEPMQENIYEGLDEEAWSRASALA